ncbi:MAG: 16S rRNA (guanine(966)-N(2))-methyltransferase RsmD [Gemmatimonadaceae bacterium]|nr:16S rRNA (guanine(966)-N(2))-methyltransferase RsmD [Gemmatimonadaceae bacterium]
MRIIGGEWRSRRIVPPQDDRVRPTADRVREAWFSMLGDAVVGARVVDLCAGSGALGLEALSRGAAHAEFVELNGKSLAALRSNIETLGAGPRATVRRADALRVTRDADAGTWDLALADPPYGLGMAATIAEQWRETPFAPLLAIEHRASDPMPVGGETRRYGDTAITFYRVPSPES